MRFPSLTQPDGGTVKRTTAVFLLLVPVLVCSCSFDPVELGDVDEFGTIFDLVWQTYDQKYVGFLWKDVDWDAQHEIYSADIDTVTTMYGLVEVLQEMLMPLQDHGILLTLGIEQFPTLELGTVEPNYDWDILWNDYLEPAGFSWFSYDVWGWCVLDSLILYVLIKDWDGYIYARELEDVIEAYPDAPAMIVDVRPTSGGPAIRVREVMKRLNDELRLGFYIAERNGPDHDDIYLDPYSIYTVPVHFDGPIAMLIGETCTQGCERFVLMGERVPQITLIGDTTRGNVSECYGPAIPGGYYRIPWQTIVLADTSEMLQDRGVYPDICVEYGEGTPPDCDPVLDYAIDWASSQ